MSPTPPIVRTLRVVAFAASLVSAPAAGLAQSAPPVAPPGPTRDHEGFWIGVGAGTGYQSIDCGACGPAPLPAKWNSGRSGGAYLAMGGTLRSNVLLGGEFAFNINSGEDVSAAVSHLGVVAQLYPTRERRLFVRVGLGVGGALLEDPTIGFPEGEELESTGITVKAGLGYDVRFGGRFALTPYVDVVQTLSEGSIATVDGRRYRGPDNPAVLQAGLSFHWY
ncbi:MAG: hypothetical protein ACXW0Z_05845 [Gemmatirosa sp.]